MNKIILVDGNNLLFRSYYATAYNGNFMKNSKNFPTNALFGFTNMMNKIIEEEQPNYIMVAFDKGKTFRHDKFDFYKDGRIETPNELIVQFPIAKKLLTAMGIKYYEIDNYEADDIIGTFAEYCNADPNFIGTIISSDKDLLQLITTDIEIKLLKQKDYIRYNEETFKAEYGINPINVIDLKALMGDSSDNIPGVKGIGEKTALKLLQDYQTLNNLYNNLDQLSPKIKEKLENDKDKAYMSYEIATIVKNIPMDINIEETKYVGSNDELIQLYEDLEFYSFIKKNNLAKKTEEISVNIITNIEQVKITEDSAYYLEIDSSNYHKCNVIGLGIYNSKTNYYVPFDVLKQNFEILKNSLLYTYDFKKNYVALKWNNIDIPLAKEDLMILSSLLEYNVKDDIAYLANIFLYDIPFYETFYKKEQTEQSIAQLVVNKAKIIYELKDKLLDELIKNQMTSLYYDIELPLTKVLGDMEYNGIVVDKKVLEEMGEEIKIKLELISNDIYNQAGEVFNISSPSQLGKILFEKLGLAHSKKGKTGYSTAIEVLNKLKGKHPIIELVIDYRMLSKLYSTYIEGLINQIHDDNKIHTIYTQTLTRTGRLSSIEPNLQNIPMRYEYGRLIRKAFLPNQNSLIVSSDYSQIELRILASMANVESLIEAFKNGVDIHTKTASDLFGVELDLVTKQMRRIAKAVNFGIIYGISSFGLSENLNITPKEAKTFIDDYLIKYPGIKEYMDKTIKQAYVDYSVKTLFNRKRNLDELKNTNHMIRATGERMALNTPIQGTSADIIKKAMVEMDTVFKLKNIQSKMLLQVHDELVFSVLNEEYDEVTKIIKEVMENVCQLDVPLEIEIDSGSNWYEAK